MSVRNRYLLFFLVMLVCLASALSVQRWSSAVTERERLQIASATSQLALIQGMANKVTRQFTNLGLYIMTGDQTHIELFEGAEEDIRQAFSEWRVNVLETVGDMEDLDEDADALDAEEGELEVVDSIAAIYSHLTGEYYQILARHDTALDRRDASGTTRVPAEFIDLEGRFEEILIPLLDAVVADEEEEVQTAIEHAADAQKRVDRVFAGVIAVIVVITAVLLVWVLNSTRAGLSSLIAAVQAYRRREYHHEIPPLVAELGLLGRTMTEMAEELRSTTVDVEHMNAVFQAINDAIFVLDEDARIIRVNAQASIMTGFREQELIGKTHRWMAERCRAGRSGDPMQMLKKLMTDSSLESFELQLVARAGHAIPVSVSAALVRDKHDMPIGAVMTARDLRESVRLREQEERAQAEALAAHEARIRADEAERSTRMKSDFLARMSHEIRTPMNGVLGMTELLSQTDLDGRQRRLLEGVRRSGDSLLLVINDILDFSKIEAGRMTIADEPFDPRVAVADVVELLGEFANRESLALTYRVEQDVPGMVQGDTVRYRQVLTNLLNNAIKFTEEGSVVAEVSVKECLENGRVLIRTEVRDTGIGLTPEAAHEVFESFSQAENFSTRRYSGTGLGLAIVRQLAELMGGSAGVETELGVGSTFWFEVAVLPLAGRVETNVECEILAGRHALVVDGNEDRGRVLVSYLCDWGMKARYESSAEGALAQLRGPAGEEHAYDILLLDTQSSELGEDRLLDAVLSEVLLPPERCMLLSPQSPDAERAEGEDACPRIDTPMRWAHLLEVLRDAVGDPDAEADTRPTAEAQATPAEFDGNILLAEDNPVNQEVGRLMLQSLGCRVTVVSDGGEAVEALAADRYDVVLMDVQMPEMNGEEATRIIRSRERAGGHRTPIVALTAHALNHERDRLLAGGMDDFMSKPYTRQQLAELLARWLPQAAAAAA